MIPPKKYRCGRECGVVTRPKNVRAHLKYSGIEQWPARKAHNLEVVGSTPTPATNDNMSLYDNMSHYKLNTITNR